MNHIYMNSAEAASYSWHLNKQSGIIPKVLQSSVAIISGIFNCYMVDQRDVENLAHSCYQCKNSYFAKSLLDRRAITIRKINTENSATPIGKLAVPTEYAEIKLTVPTEYENHKKVLIFGAAGSGKSMFITKLLGKNVGDDGSAARNISNPKFYKLNDKVVLCEEPISINCDFNRSSSDATIDNYDSTVYLLDTIPILDQYLHGRMIKSKNSGKPYFVVLNKIDRTITNWRFDNRDKQETTQLTEIVNHFHDKITNSLIENDAMPNNKKCFIVSTINTDDYDFNEVSRLIHSHDFSYKEETIDQARIAA